MLDIAGDDKLSAEKGSGNMMSFFNPLPLPVALFQETHFKCGRFTVGACLAILISNADFPPAFFTACQRLTLVDHIDHWSESSFPMCFLSLFPIIL